MFDMGFIDDINKIVAEIPKTCQKLLFGATMPSAILEIVKNYMTNPIKVKMPTYVDKSKLMQHYYDINRKDKFSLLVDILKKESKGLTLIFCGTRQYVDIVNANLAKQNIKSEAIHGGITQNRRRQVMDAFREGKLDVLVASDVAARGLDIKDVNLVINYDLPRTSEEYVHRIGRTARAGKEGKVISLLCREDYRNFRRILQDKSLFIHKIATPDFNKVPFLHNIKNEKKTYFAHQKYFNKTKEFFNNKSGC
jgi:ATP-dependent RNA helicase DeaD